MRVCINGESREVADGMTLAALLAQLEVNQTHVAVEVNQQLVPREQHGQRLVASGDHIEIVTLVGGG